MEIALRRGPLDRRALLVLLLHVAVAAAVVVAAAALLDGVALVVVLVALLVPWLASALAFALTWRRLRAVEHPLGLHAFGVFSRSPLGRLTVPWEAVESVSLERGWRGRTLRIRLVPAADPRAAGVVVDDLPAATRRTVQRHGIRVSVALLDLDLEQLREAFAVESGGRVRVA